MEFYFLLAAFFLIALIYASVGFGGGSSYLAILALQVFALSFPLIRTTALLCNIVVVAGSTYLFLKEKKITWADIFPYAVGSVPFAYIGAFWPVRTQTSFILLGVALVVAAVLLWWQPEEFQKWNPNIKQSNSGKWLLGSSIGLLSGLVGIGGGIFLSPVLYFLRWLDASRIAAVCSVFILVNSIGGLIGQWNRGWPALEFAFIGPMLLAVLAGGQLGTRLGLTYFNQLYIRRITALLIFVAGLNILKDHL